MQKRASRVVIDKVSPSVDGGKFAVKRCQGDLLAIEAVLIADGHDLVAGRAYYKTPSDRNWNVLQFQSMGNDIYQAQIPLTELGHYEFKVEAWLDAIESWCQAIEKKHQAHAPFQADLLMGTELLQHWGESEKRKKGWFTPREKQELAQLAEQLHKSSSSSHWQEIIERVRLYNQLYPYRYLLEEDKTIYRVWVDRKRAEFSAWYEFFPRSTSPNSDEHGSFKDCINILPYVASMGFDVIYFPPIHPIGHKFRKGPNNSLTASTNDPGSPWAIGSEDGGHKALHSQLGSFKDFDLLLKKASELNLEIAMDLAFQCSADHPYLKQHPEWFRKRPDGSIQYAENPPKKYQDIYPFYFEGPAFKELWTELRSIVMFWIERGIKIFRVDNPHTKPFPFWQWLIAEIQQQHPDVIFLSEAFTRPHVVYYLAKIGFSQSYTYFTWRVEKEELEQYLMEVTRSEVAEFYRPNFWPNTPDILSGPLRNGTSEAYAIRLISAATMTSNYGIYGPAFETCVNEPFSEKDEEYNDSEKYVIKHWPVFHNEQDKSPLAHLISQVNQIRKKNPAFHSNRFVELHQIDNPHMTCFSRYDPEKQNALLIIINLDALNRQSGWTQLKMQALDLDEDQNFEVEDLLSGEKYQWQGRRNYVELNPQKYPAHILKINGSHYGTRSIHSAQDPRLDQH